ncbi:Uncharacterized protein FWK35_00031219 [Aphis craccivora]|uniref:Uncharacterized protein n=1 Tax=Aphis craccivora TaxID=307492 RepID=A0A6G0YKN9_APHCR|nr:Uncharacterized protein FWK35_00031219 [Aphis craccivora]
MEPRIAGDDAKNRSRSTRTDSGRLVNMLGNATSTLMRPLSVGGGSEANACCEPKTPSNRAETVSGGRESRTLGWASANEINRWATAVGRSNSSASREEATAFKKDSNRPGGKFWSRSLDDAALITIVLSVSPTRASRTCGAVAATRSNEAITVGRSSCTVFGSDSVASKAHRAIAGIPRTDSGSAADSSETMRDTSIRFSADGVSAKLVQRSASVSGGTDVAISSGVDDSRPSNESSAAAGAASIRHDDEDRVAINAARHSDGRPLTTARAPIVSSRPVSIASGTARRRHGDAEFADANR